MSSPLSPFLIAMGGGTGSGKTTLAKRLVERYAQLGVALVDQDSYYFDRSHLSDPERARANFDEPAALDHDLLFEHLQWLLRGEAIEKPRYSFATHTRPGEFDRVASAPLIVLEGLFALWDSRVRALAGLKIYVDAAADLRFIRRLRRDVEERGRTWQLVVEQYEHTVRPMHQQHIEPTKAFADLVLDTTDEPLEESVRKVCRNLYAVCPALKESAPSLELPPNGRYNLRR